MTQTTDKQTRRRYAAAGERSQQMVSFRCDMENVEFLAHQPNKGRYLNDLIARERERVAGMPADSRTYCVSYHPEGKEKKWLNRIADIYSGGSEEPEPMKRQDAERLQRMAEKMTENMAAYMGKHHGEIMDEYVRDWEQQVKIQVELL